MFFGIQKYLIGGALILSVAGGAYFYINNLRMKVATLESERAVLSVANDNLSKTLENALESSRQQSERISSLQDRLSVAERQSDELKRILLDHDLTDLALKKPGLIEERVNDGTKDIFRTIESDTTE